jgi:hypothetical protein
VSAVRDHWWWRPGWRPGRRFYTFHLTWRDQPAVQELAAQARARLAQIRELDLVPGQWLHLTTQGIEFTDEVSGADLAAITAAARARLAAVHPALVQVAAPKAASEGVVCWVGPLGALFIHVGHSGSPRRARTPVRHAGHAWTAGASRLPLVLRQAAGPLFMALRPGSRAVPAPRSRFAALPRHRRQPSWPTSQEDQPAGGPSGWPTSARRRTPTGATRETPPRCGTLPRLPPLERLSCCPLMPGIAVRDGDGEFVEKTAELGAVGHFEECAVRHRDVANP